MWSVERRENLFEDHSMADRVKRGEATAQQFFDYYLGWLTNPEHHGPLPPLRSAARRTRAGGACESRSRT